MKNLAPAIVIGCIWICVLFSSYSKAIDVVGMACFACLATAFVVTKMKEKENEEIQNNDIKETNRKGS